jgi:hypothetical protein
MSRRRSELEHFIKTVLYQQGDNQAKEIYEDCRYRYKKMIQSLSITEKTIAAGLKIMAYEIFIDRCTYYDVLVLLTFCIELNKHCTTLYPLYPWYNIKILVEILVNILSDVNFIPPPTSFNSSNICIIIYVIVLLFLLHSILQIYTL